MVTWYQFFADVAACHVTFPSAIERYLHTRAKILEHATYNWEHISFTTHNDKK